MRLQEGRQPAQDHTEWSSWDWSPGPEAPAWGSLSSTNSLLLCPLPCSGCKPNGEAIGSGN